jgi:nucleoside-diphosphate-sugar epimerase
VEADVETTEELVAGDPTRRRIALLGGTRFIGAATLEELTEHDQEVLVVHRGETERDDLPAVDHAHLDRHDVEGLRTTFRDFGAQVVVDTCAYTRADAADLAAAADDDVRLVVLSSQDVYRQFERLRTDAPSVDAVPLDEDAPLRVGPERYLFRGEARPAGVGAAGMEDYDNLDVEEVVLPRGATVLRLALVYGERDPMRREEFVLRQVRAGADRIEVGAGTLLWTRCWVRDVARAIRLTCENDAAAGLALNIGERRTVPVLAWVRAILDAADHDAPIDVVPDDALPSGLGWTGVRSQHVLTDSGRARQLLGWQDRDLDTAVRASVRWHLANPPDDWPG